MRNSFLRLVPHVGKAEGFPFDSAVAAVDDEVMLGAQVAHELGDVDAAAVADAGERLGAEAFFGEEIEAALADPIVDEGVRFCVALVAVRQAFGEDVVELGFERVDVRDARRGGSHVVFLVLFELEKIEIVAAVLLFLGARESFFGNGKEREAGWQSERFLAAGEENIDAEIIHRNRHGGEGGDAVDDESHVRIFFGDGADFFERIHDASGGFVVD